MARIFVVEDEAPIRANWPSRCVTRAKHRALLNAASGNLMKRFVMDYVRALLAWHLATRGAA
jgi:hypothetical protein